jgi:hypothetical protein
LTDQKPSLPNQPVRSFLLKKLSPAFCPAGRISSDAAGEEKMDAIARRKNDDLRSDIFELNSTKRYAHRNDGLPACRQLLPELKDEEARQ